MTAVLEAVRDKPVALFELDTAAPYPDASGYGRVGTVTGTSTKAAGLAAGNAYSTVFSKNAIGKFDCPSPVFSQGYEDRPFSLEAWVNPISRTLGLAAPTQYTNLLTNPGFESRGGLSTLYTNLCTNPVPASATGYSAANGATVVYDGTNLGVHVTIASGGVADAGAAMTSAMSAVTSGNGYRYSVEVEAVAAGSIKLSVQGSTVSGGTLFTTPVTFNAGEKKRITTASVTAIANGTPSVYVLRGNSNAHDFIIRKVLMIQTTNDIDYFDGATKTGSWNDSDFTVAWNGTANASTSKVQGTTVTGVNGSSQGKVVSSSQWAANGTYSLRITGSQVSSMDCYATMSLVGFIQEGKTYTIMGTLRQVGVLTGTSNPATQQRNLFLDITGGGGTVRGFGQTTAQANAAGVYQHSITFTVPKVAGDPVTSLNVRMYNGFIAGLGNDVWWDNLALVEGNYTGPFFDGSVPGYEWTGTANASSSRTKADAARINLAVNPSADGATFLSGYAGVGGAAAMSIQSDGGYLGSKYHRWTYSTAPSNGGSGLYHLIKPIFPGMTVTASAWVRINRAGSIRAGLDFKDNTGNAANTINPSSTAVSANTWTRISVTGTATLAQTAQVACTFYQTSTIQVGDTIDVDGILIEYSSSVGTYFDGSYPGAVWSGTSGNSWSYCLPSDADTQILGNNGKMDGLTINGTVVSFVTKYLTSGECRASYDLQMNRRFDAIGVHTAEKNSLYIDGVLVAETETTDAQKLDKFVATDVFLYSGTTTSSKCLAMNNVGIYGTALTQDSISRHFAIGNKHLSRNAILKGFAGARVPLSQNEGDIFLEQTWTTKADWTAATLTDTVVVNDQLRPVLDSTGVSKAGTWTDLFVMSVSDATSIYGVNMIWDGNGATIQASLDGTTWETVERGKNLGIIPPGFNPQNKELLLKISFTGGVLDDPAYVDNLTVSGFKTGVTPPVHGRTITYTAPAYVRNDHEPVEYSDDFGVRLKYGSVVIGADTSDDPFLPGTIELWIKNNSPERFYIDGRINNTTDTTNFRGQMSSSVFFPTNTVVYVNGTLRTTEVLNVGEWTLLHFVPTVAPPSSIYINSAVWGSQVDTSTGDITVGHVVLYENALTAAQIAAIYESYIGLNSAKAPDSSFIQITEPTNAAQVIAADWTITAAG